ncbi:MAG: DUF4338 domain-containing protein [Ruminiclostridium sp.]|nr:DUF4338 domain-containing protein [Ruminiclostridium sp.]
MLRRPEITDDLIKQINNVINEHPDWHRTKISKYLCELWDWRMPNGQLKDISCRDMLRALNKAGKIVLPKAIRSSGNAPSKHKYSQTFLHDKTPIEAKLSALQPLQIKAVEEKQQVHDFKSYIEQYHYLGFDCTVGENMKYMVYGVDGRLLACLLFGSAAWSCHGRDAYIGWSQQSRKSNLQEMTNNVRYLVLPWVKVPHLASHILSLISRRLSSDWEKKYGHPIYCLETFVECDRFKGTCYKAANWICVGKTVGRGRDDINNKASLPIKHIYLYPLNKKYRQLLGRNGETL